jgi:solute carrier family 27 fatty acid transporter 1/4
MNVVDVFDTVVKKTPDKIAVIFQHQEWTFTRLQDFTLRLANFFAEEGITEGNTVAVFVHNCPEQIGTWLGLSRLGAVSALVHYNLRRDLLAHCVALTNPKAIIFSKSLYPALSEVMPTLGDKLGPDLKLYCIDGSLENTEVFDLPSKLTTASAEPRKERTGKSFEEIIMYMFSSGTTGPPKAAKISNRKYFSAGHGISLLYSLRPSDVLYVCLPLYHLGGTGLYMSQMVLKGCTVVLRNEFCRDSYWNDCIRHQCTVATYIGEMCRYLLSQPKKPADTQHCVRVMIGNGLKQSYYEEFKSRFNIKQLGECYGSTEGNVGFVNTENRPGAVGFCMLLFAISHPILKVDPNTGELIRDRNGLCVCCKPGEKGVIVGKLEHKKYQYLGYYNETETEKRVIHNVLKKGDSYFNTNDVMVMDEEGYVYFCDRLGDTFRWKAQTVSTFVVESTMSKLLSNRDVIVYGVAVPGCEGRAGMAAIVDGSNEVAMENLYHVLKDDLPYYAIPLFVRKIKAAPLTTTMKFQKVKMRNEGFDIGSVTDPVYFLHPTQKSYVLVTESLLEQIRSGDFTPML